MSSGEGIPPANRSEVIHESELRREAYFRGLVMAHLRNTIEHALENSGFSAEETDEFLAEIAKLPEVEQFSALAIPFELRESLFKKYLQQVDEGEMTIEKVIADIVRKNTEFGFTVGYHLSDHKIEKELGAGKKVWNVKGSEFDDRDEMKMAYYSEDYLHRYKKKPGRFLYVVRAETGEKTAHKRDLDNRWSRAPLLSIIDECDMREIQQEIEEAVKKENAAPVKRAA